MGIAFEFAHSHWLCLLFILEHKETIITYEESMGNINEYQKLLEPITKQEKVSETRRTDVCNLSQCNKSRHFKEHCHWNLNNLNNKLKTRRR